MLSGVEVVDGVAVVDGVGVMESTLLARIFDCMYATYCGFYGPWNTVDTCVTH